MKNTYNIIKSAFVLFAAAAVLSACSEDAMDRVNENPNDPKDVAAQFIMVDLIVSTATNTVGGDMSLYTSVYMELEGGTHNQLYDAEKRLNGPTSSSTVNNQWVSVYANILNAKTIISKCSPGGSEEGNLVTRGIAEVLLAYNLGVLTDMFGDVPFAQSGIKNPNGTPKYMQPEVQKQEVLHDSITKLLDRAIVDFGGEDLAFTGSSYTRDLIYGVKNHKELWLKTAYGLKARYAMRTLARSADKTADLNKILGWIDLSYADVSEQAAFYYDGNSSVTPLSVFFDSRVALGASKSYVDKLVARNDPRYKAFVSYTPKATQVSALTEIYSVPNGNPVQSQGDYSFSIGCQSPSSPVYLLSYHELLFLKAEAQARLSLAAQAAATLDEAVDASLAATNYTINSSMEFGWVIPGQTDFTITPAEVTAVKDGVATRIASGTPILNEVMIEKYLSAAGPGGEALEAYCDYRRMKALGENIIVLANPNNATKFPLRLAYGTGDVLANPNIGKLFGNGQYVYSKPVWWAGGSEY